MSYSCWNSSQFSLWFWFCSKTRNGITVILYLSNIDKKNIEYQYYELYFGINDHFLVKDTQFDVSTVTECWRWPFLGEGQGIARNSEFGQIFGQIIIILYSLWYIFIIYGLGISSKLGFWRNFDQPWLGTGGSKTGSLWVFLRRSSEGIDLEYKDDCHSWVLDISRHKIHYMESLWFSWIDRYLLFDP